MFPAAVRATSAMSVLAGAVVFACRPVAAQVQFDFDKLMAADGAGGDQFGNCVDIHDDLVIVGASLDDTIALSGPGSIADAGSASVFRSFSGLWLQEAQLIASDRALNDHFGTGVAIDGPRALVGAQDEEDSTPSAPVSIGSTYAFNFDGSSWNQSQKLRAADPQANAQFGCAVAMDGLVAVIGAKYGGSTFNAAIDHGAVYVFGFNGSSWVQSAKLIASDGAPFDHFGWSVAIDGNVIVVGAPDHDAGGLVTNNQGTAYVFRFNGASWVQEAKLNRLDPAAGDAFGRSVAVRGDVIVVGSSQDDQSVSVTNSGSAYVFRYNSISMSWSQQAKLLAPTPASNAQFGSSVGISGQTIVVGAEGSSSNAGVVYGFRFDGLQWVPESDRFNSIDGNTGHHLGISLAMNGDLFVAGANGANGNAIASGAAYLFEFPPPPCPTIVLSVPSDTTIECGASELPDNTGNATATGQNVQVDYADQCVVNDDPYILGDIGCMTCPRTIIRTWTAVDECDNTASGDQVIIVADTTDPEFTYVPANVGPASLTEEQTAAGSPETGGPAAAHDNCSSVTIGSSDSTETLPNGDLQITRTWTATDACNNSTSAVQTITVIGTSPCPPLVLTVPGNVTIECGESESPSNTGTATATGSMTEVTYVDECVPDDNPETPETIECQTCPRVIHRTWTATDDCDGVVSQVQTITVADTDPPEFTYVPGNVGPLPLSEEQSAPGSSPTGGPATAFDTCSNVVIGSSDSTVMLPNGDKQITRTWTATDGCNAIASLPQIITIITDQSDCNEQTIEVNGSVSVNVNPLLTGGQAIYSGDPDLAPFMSVVYNLAQPVQTWKVVFNVGQNKLLVTSGATITVATVPLAASERFAPGLELRSSCSVEIQPGGSVAVTSSNRTSGGVLVAVDGDIIINGSIISQTNGTNNGPGPVTIASAHGNISTGTSSLIATRGPVGAGINIVNGCEAGGQGGNIVINGLVDSSYKSGSPVVNVVAFGGAVTIDGNTLQGIEAGTSRRITTGVTVRNTSNPQPGRINIQADGDVTVIGNAVLDFRYPNIGAVGVKSGSNGSIGGTIDVRSVNGSIIATDRAFDTANRYNTAAVIDLRAAMMIGLSATPNRANSVKVGADPLAMPVVSSQAGRDGTGGINTLLSGFGGLIGPKAEVLADHAEPTNGANGVNKLCIALLADPNSHVAPNRTNAAPGVVNPLFNSCADLGVTFP